MTRVDEFIAVPSEAFLDQCTGAQLVKVAEHYEIAVGDKKFKENIKAIIKANFLWNESFGVPRKTWNPSCSSIIRL